MIRGVFQEWAVDQKHYMNHIGITYYVLLVRLVASSSESCKIMTSKNE